MLIDPRPYPEYYADYRQNGGYLAWEKSLGMDENSVIAVLKASGLRGRGGAGFPVASKWEAVRQQPGSKVVIMNGEEGEPGSLKDVWLMQNRPHLVLEGALIATRTVGAERLVLYLSDEAPDAHTALRQALVDFETDVRSKEPPLPQIDFVVVPHTYVAGEETSAIAAVEGQRAEPRFKPPRPFESGVEGKPTLVQNTETLANVPMILRHGADAFRQKGIDNASGTVLAAILGAVCRPGLYEIPLGMPLGQAMHLAGGLEPGRTWTGTLIGGYFGGFLPADPMILLDYDSIRARGGALGNAEITILDDHTCPVHLAEQVTQFFARESCAQCGVCQRLTRTLAQLVAQLARGEAGDDAVDRLRRYGRQMQNRGACALPDGPVTVVRTLSEVYSHAVYDHAVDGTCTACRDH